MPSEKPIPDIQIIQGDARHLPLADESVQCIVTSPPYWGLRKYSGEQELVWGGTESCEHEWQMEAKSAPGTSSAHSSSH